VARLDAASLARGRRVRVSDSDSSGVKAPMPSPASPPLHAPLPALGRESVEISVKYAKYLERQEKEVERISVNGHARIPGDFDYAAIVSLRNEAKQKFSRIRPLNLDQAGRISGITPSDVALVLAYLENPRLRSIAQGKKVGTAGDEAAVGEFE
jgi:hypothetical protein